jgi:hypothetical protein
MWSKNIPVTSVCIRNSLQLKYRRNKLTAYIQLVDYVEINGYNFIAYNYQSYFVTVFVPLPSLTILIHLSSNKYN